ncbi:MAG: peptidylprolyl isomerase [Ferrimonas sp.]
MIIDNNTVVTLHYRLRNSAGEIIEESFGAEPMEYLHGADNLIPGLEAQLQGKQAGDQLDADIVAADAYGDIELALIQEVPLAAFEGVEDIIPGMRFMAQTDAGPRPVVVTEVKDDTVIVDGNHPMAGQDLNFQVEVVAVREGTEEEIEQGHPASVGGGCCGGGCGSHHHHEEEEEHGCCGSGACGSHDHGHDHAHDDHECCGGTGSCGNGDECCGKHSH